MATTEETLARCEVVLKQVETTLKENQELKEELKVLVQQLGQQQQLTMFSQNIINQVAHYMTEDRLNDGQWKMQQYVMQVQVRVEGDKTEIGRLQLVKPSAIKTPNGGLILP